MYRPIDFRRLGTAVMFAAVGAVFVLGTYPQTAQAQTNGMERRQDRRDTRQESRTEKHECNASGDNSRAGCRQEKRETKQSGRQDRAGQPTTPP